MEEVFHVLGPLLPVFGFQEFEPRVVLEDLLVKSETKFAHAVQFGFQIWRFGGLVGFVEDVVFLVMLKDKSIEGIESRVKLGIHRRDDIFLDQIGLVLEEMKLAKDHDQGQKGSQAADPCADPVEHFQPQGDFPVFHGPDHGIEYQPK